MRVRRASVMIACALLAAVAVGCAPEARSFRPDLRPVAPAALQRSAEDTAVPDHLMTAVAKRTAPEPRAVARPVRSARTYPRDTTDADIARAAKAMKEAAEARIRATRPTFPPSFP